LLYEQSTGKAIKLSCEKKRMFCEIKNIDIALVWNKWSEMVIKRGNAIAWTGMQGSSLSALVEGVLR
jgi:hypothetical protein